MGVIMGSRLSNGPSQKEIVSPVDGSYESSLLGVSPCMGEGRDHYVLRNNRDHSRTHLAQPNFSGTCHAAKQVLSERGEAKPTRRNQEASDVGLNEGQQSGAVLDTREGEFPWPTVPPHLRCMFPLS